MDAMRNTFADKMEEIRIRVDQENHHKKFHNRHFFDSCKSCVSERADSEASREYDF